MKFKKKIIGIVIGFLIGICAIVGITSNINKNSTNTLEGPKEGTFVKVAKAQIKDIQTKVSASGTLKAETEQTLFAESTNRIITINKEVGDSVKKGEIIFTLDKDEKDRKQKEITKVQLSIESTQIALDQMKLGSKQEVLQAQSKIADLQKTKQDSIEDIRGAKAVLEAAKVDEISVAKQYELTQELFVQGLKSQQELDNDTKSLDLAKEKITELNHKIALLEKGIDTLGIQEESANYALGVLLNNVEDKNKAQNIAMKQNEIKTYELQKQNLVDELAKAANTIVATMDGIIAEVNVEEGSYIVPGTQLVKIINPDKLIVESEVSPFYASQLQQGLEATIKYNGSQTVELKGRVSKVSPTATTKQGPNDSKVTAVPVEIEITDKQNLLKPGLVVDIRIITNDVKDVVTVPILATMEDKQGEGYILVITKDFRIEKRYINQGAADNLAVEIKALKEGEVVITNPTEALEEGMAVNYIPFEDTRVKDKTEGEGAKNKEGVNK